MSETRWPFATIRQRNCSPQPMPKWMWKACCREQGTWPRHSRTSRSPTTVVARAGDPEPGGQSPGAARMPARWVAHQDVSTKWAVRSVGGHGAKGAFAHVTIAKRCVSKDGFG